jgi:hypothetical protein
LAFDRVIVEPDQLVWMAFAADRASEFVAYQFWVFGL